MRMIRNSIFSIFFFTGIIIISLIFLPTFFLPQKVVLLGGKLMGYWTSFCLKFFLSTKIVIKGKENIINDESFFIAASHQSMFETFYLQTIFNSPVFILKKELLFIPIFGWYLKKIGSISIKRDKITKDNLGFFENISKIISKSKRPLIIFKILSKKPKLSLLTLFLRIDMDPIFFKYQPKIGIISNSFLRIKTGELKIVCR